MATNLDRIPDISFVEDIDLDEVLKKLVKDYEEKYKELTGLSEYSLPKTSPYKIILNALALQLFQAYIWIDKMGKMNLLKYSYGDFLDNLALNLGVERKAGEKARAMFRFKMSSQVGIAVNIPAGAKITNGLIYFYTIKDGLINAGETQIDLEAECSEIGKAYNGYEVGTIDVLVDSIPYISEVKNITKTDYGTDIESDDDLRQRISVAPSSYSTAGPANAYEYFVRQYSTLISDVKVTNPSPRLVDIRIVLKGGKLPEKEFCDGLKEYLSKETRRPLTDIVQVDKPKQVIYNLDLTYYINESDKKNATTIQKRINEAIESYIEWQSEVIGRDVNPDKLMSLIINAGAKRVVIKAPVFQRVDNTDITVIDTLKKSINYGGFEDD